MKEIKDKNFYVFFIILILAIISLLIIKSFILPLVFTGILVYLFHPIYKIFIKVFKNHFITSILMILIIIVVIIIPFLLIISEISNEISTLDEINMTASFSQGSKYINDKFSLNINLESEYQSFISKIQKEISIFIYQKLPYFLFNIFIIIFFFYYFLKNYNKESEYFKLFFEKMKIFKINYKIKKLVNGIIYGQILIRFIQALTGGVLFFLIGVNGAFLWGVLMFFASFLPIIGTGLIWGPLVFIKIMTQEYDLALYIFIIGIFISVLDNILVPFIISNRINIGPVVTLISILGGIELFGIYGIIIGPFALGLLFVFLDDLLLKLKEDKEIKKRYVWTIQEREKYKSLMTKQAKEEYIRMLNKNYEIEEMFNNSVNYRYEKAEELEGLSAEGMKSWRDEGLER
jgi:predicted PurR-regulated permease PerM